MRYGILAAAVGLAVTFGVVADSTAADPGVSQTASATGLVDDGAENGSDVWFSLADPELRFEAPGGSVKDADGLFAAIKSAADRSIQLTVRYDPDSGYIDPASGKATFDIREVTVDGKTIVGVASSSDVRRTPTSRAEVDLATALGEVVNGDRADALSRISAALSDANLPTRWRISALKTRADAYESIALEDLSTGPDRDHQLALSLADNRAWASLAPDDADAASAVAYSLEMLGGFEDALVAYRGIAAKWPDQDFPATIRIAAAYRIMGQFDRALATLDDLVKRKGPQTGMRYFYHRGRILLALGQSDEAAKLFTEGLKDQPDYRGAFMYRACALAAAGHLTNALSDQQTVIDSMVKDSGLERPSPATSFDIGYAGQVAEKLRAALAVSQTSRAAGLCDGYWDDGDKLRPRSPLLPPAAPTR